ncbi:LysR substrate-binding domain-containing protein [Microbacterium betulae]|uniref:LysR substrate-binding domain-containing protein n=1 Tax=Microbacterium betulae TaxID=2981139 RepID=A0AA97FG13_9MICO|nr:LysR substrate-binding domain-containing protein [Microbacterium sp. AB]WOF22228.1 LysR substrate-binding domain-containing protein [Microbacterium sp. AB]
MFTLDQVRCFVAVAEELHFGRAAARLRMTQPPLSRQIQRLESILAVTLLDRDNRRVTLTEAGRAFLREGREILAAVDRAPATAREVAAGRIGVVRIGFTAASGYSVLGPLLTTIAEELPRVRVELEELVTGQQKDALDAGSLDLGLARPPFDPARFDSRPLLAEDLVLAVPVGHPLAASAGAPTPDTLRREPLIMHSATNARYFHDLSARMLPADHAGVVHVVSQIATMVALVAARHGVAFVPESARLLGIDGVAYLDLGEEARGVVRLAAIWSRTNGNPALHRVVQLLGAD